MTYWSEQYLHITFQRHSTSPVLHIKQDERRINIVLSSEIKNS